MKTIAKFLRGWVAVGLTLCALSAAEHHGTVKFAGLPVPGVTVTLTQGDKKLTAVTDMDGVYAFADVPDGVYNLDIEMLCFQPLKQEVAIAPGAPSPQWELKLQSLDEIKSSAPAPAPNMIQKVDTSAPANTAPVAGSASATPPTPSIAGAATPTASNKNSKNSKNSKNAKNAAATPAQSGGFQRTDVNASAGAAAAAADTTPPTMAGAAEAQSSSDALVVNGSQSSGIERRVLGNNRKGPASLYRGDISFVVDNSYLDARNFSLTGQNTYKPSYDKINSGVSVGGPLYIPHVLRSNGQVFLSYQITRNRNGYTETGTMPTAAEMAGNFNGVLNALGQQVQVIDPTTGQAFPNNVIPTNRISPQALSLLKYYPTPNFLQTAQYNYQIAATGRNDSDNVQTRINRNLNQKNYVFGAFNYQNNRAENTNPNVFNFIDNSAGSGMNANANYRHVFSPRLNVTAGVSFSHFSSNTYPFFANKINVSGLAGITGNDQEPLYWGPPNLGFNQSGITGLGDATPSTIHNQTTAATVSGLWIRRPHEISFGADIRRQQFNSLSQNNPRGNFGFTGAATGWDFSDFLLGVPDTAGIAYGNADKYFRSYMDDAYISDAWRVGPALSVTLGVRWEYGSPMVEKYGRLVNLDEGPFYSSVAPVVGFSPTGSISGQHYADSLIKPYKRAFQPRAALAWRPIFGDSLVVRANYGIYYDTSLYQRIANLMAQQSPLSRSLSVFNSPSDPLTLANGWVASPNLTTNTFAVDPNFRPGYVHNWTATAQRDLPGGMILNLTYLGIKGTHAQQAFLPYTFPSTALNFCPSCPTGYSYLTSNGNSEREAGTIQLRRRLHNGLTASVQYTYSHAIDDAASLGGRGSGGSPLAQNWLDLEAERSSSSFDQRHNVQLQFQYTSGMGLKGGTLLGGWRGAALKGWTVLTNVNWGSGLPLTPTCSACQVLNTTGTVRPEYFGGDIYAGQPGYYLNSMAYGLPINGQWGNAGRNSIIGPDQFSLNGSAARSFGQVDIRLDASNALNHVVFGSWNPNISSPQFGLPTGPNAMRVVRLTLRMRF